MREKKPNKRKVQGAETKKKLYEIAAKLFAQHDYADVSVEDITDAAGITKGAFYVHFESKDALIAELIADQAARVDIDYKDFVNTLPSDMPTSAVILALTEKIADVLIHSIGHENMKKVYQLLLEGAVDSESVKGYNREIYALFSSIITKGMNQGEFKNTLSPEALSQHFVMTIRGACYEWCIRFPAYDLKDQAVEHCRLLIEGILA